MCLRPQWASANPLANLVEEDMDYSKRSMPEPLHGVRRDVWSLLFGYDNPAVRHSPHQHGSPSLARIRLIPFDKRTIPIELQKAFYAHGIVGRRR